MNIKMKDNATNVIKIANNVSEAIIINALNVIKITANLSHTLAYKIVQMKKFVKIKNVCNFAKKALNRLKSKNVYQNVIIY